MQTYYFLEFDHGWKIQCSEAINCAVKYIEVWILPNLATNLNTNESNSMITTDGIICSSSGVFSNHVTKAFKDKMYLSKKRTEP